MVTISWLLFLIGLMMAAWYLWIRGRGSLRFWIRAVDQDECWILGRVLPIDASHPERQALLTEVNAAVRSLDQRATTVLREWDRESGALFMGLLLKAPLEDVPAGFEQRHWEEKKVLRLSGMNRLDERNHIEILEEYLGRRELTVDRARSMELSGQSFSLYQWNVSRGEVQEGSLAKLEEGTFQLRDNLVLPTVGSVITAGLLGTGQPLLFAIGVLLVVFLSGACKFVFIHQRADEADEIHLQNY